MTLNGRNPGWVDVPPAIKFGATIPFILSPADGEDRHRLVKDLGNNISTPASASILVNTSGYLCVSKWGKPGRGASLLHGGEFMAPMYGLAIDQQGSILSSTMETTVFKVDRNEFHHSLGKFRRRQCELQSDRYCLRRQRRCLRGRYEQSPASRNSTANWAATSMKFGFARKRRRPVQCAVGHRHRPGAWVYLRCR